MPPPSPPARCLLHAAVAVRAAAVHGRGVRRAGAVSVLLRPHRQGDRRGDARGPAQGVRGVRAVRRGDPGPAGRGHVRALEADAASATRRSRALYEQLLSARAASSPAATPTRSSSTRPPGGCGSAAGRSSSCATSPRSRGPCRARAPAVELATHGEPRISDGRHRARAAVGSADRGERGLARTAVPARRHLGRRRHQLLAVLRARRAGRAVPVRRRRRGDADRAGRAASAQLALLPAGRRAGPALRLPRPRALRAARGHALQPRQAAARPLREGDRRRRRLGPRRERPAVRPRPARRTPTSSPTTRTTPRRCRSRS